MAEQPADRQKLKREIRTRAHSLRRSQEDKDRLSGEICRKLADLPEYRAAVRVMFYLDFRSEVRTRNFVPTAWEQGKRTVVPYCLGDRLELFCLESFDELESGTWGILEPKAAWRGRAERKIDVSRLDLIVVPGVAFDRAGGRLGHGKGYYDHLLREARADTRRVALAFECQLFPAVPMLPHDVYMDKVITEKAVYERQAR